MGDTHEPRRAALLAVAIALSVGGVTALGAIDGHHAAGRRVIAPEGSGFDAMDFAPHATTETSWLSQFLRKQRGSGAGSYEPPRADPEDNARTPGTAPRPDAQVDVAVPAAGAHAAAGQGDGSCTTVGLTAITPDGCPPPGGEGPVIVRYQGTGVGPKTKHSSGLRRGEAAA